MARMLLCAAFFILHSSLFISCDKDPDEENLYTFTGQTVEDYLLSQEQLTSFHYILQRVGFNETMSTYGEYTCFAPVNDAVTAYIDSLYNDPEAFIPHNSMEDHGPLSAGQHAQIEWLSDSLCNDLARLHLSNSTYSASSLAGTSIHTMLGRDISASVNSQGQTVLNVNAAIISYDHEATNGVVHILNHVITRSSRLLADELEQHPEFSIFSEALKLTNLGDSMLLKDKGKTYSFGNNPEGYYVPSECKLGYTILAETDEVMRQAGINDINDLIAYANNAYGQATEWYDYMREKGQTVSIGSDYTNRNNALNMFVAYHLLSAKMAQDQFLIYDNYPSFNYKNNADTYDYYETMLPHALIKVWQPLLERNLYVNRWRENNTLTDEIGTQGSEAIHPLKRSGVQIVRRDIDAENGYIHPLDGMLVYDADVPRGVLNERLRFDSSTFLPEMINNGLRYSTGNDFTLTDGTVGSWWLRFDLDYFDGVRCYGDGNKLNYCVRGNWICWQADQFQVQGVFDVLIKLPPVPYSGTWELRVPVVQIGWGGFCQYYYGTSDQLKDMIALDIPIDTRIPLSDPRVGWKYADGESDKGVATDEVMRNHGWMRAPKSYGGANKSEDARNDANSVRRILGRLPLKQSETYWLRMKAVDPNASDGKCMLDYVELVPTTVVDNDTYSEDWY